MDHLRRMPVPDATGPDQIFQRALTNGEIMLPRCDDCGAYHFFPRVLCPHCHGTAISWHPASGKGRVHTTTVVRRKPVRIAAEHLGLDLDTLQDIYGALGR